MIRLRGIMGAGAMERYKDLLCEVEEHPTCDPAFVGRLRRAGAFEQLEGAFKECLEESKECERCAVEIGAAPEADRAGPSEEAGTSAAEPGPGPGEPPSAAGLDAQRRSCAERLERHLGLLRQRQRELQESADADAARVRGRDPPGDSKREF